MPIVQQEPSKWTTPADIMAMQTLGPLLRGYVPWTAWSIRPSALVTVVNEIAERGRSQVMELGSGTSTVVLGHALRRYGGLLVSVEHDPQWADFVRREIELHGLRDVVHVEAVPLTPLDEVAGDSTWQMPTHWYNRARLTEVAPEGIDLLFVDGPPGGERPDVLAREPAARTLKDQLSSDFTIVLDDVDRGAEYETVHRWEHELALEMTVIERSALAVGRAATGRSTGGFVPAF